MKHLAIIAASAVLLAACAPTPTPLCDRATVEWNKYGTAEVQQECEARYVPVVVAAYNSDRSDDHYRVRVVEPTDTHSHSGPPDTYVKPSGGLYAGVGEFRDLPNHNKPKSRKPKAKHIGNPGNDKNVGRAGEKKSKGMAERGDAGNRGKSN